MISVINYVINDALSSAHVKFYAMSVELGVKIKQVGKEFVGKIGNLARGHTLEEETYIRRVLCDPSSVSPDDVGKYLRRKLNSAVLSAVHPLLGGNATILGLEVGAAALQEELERQKGLTWEQLSAEVIADAQKKAKEWKL